VKLLNLDAAEENLLAWLIQCCLSDRLLAKSGLPPDLEEQYLAPVRTLDAKLMEIGARERPGSVPECGEMVLESELLGLAVRCTRPAGHVGGHFHEQDLRRQGT